MENNSEINNKVVTSTSLDEVELALGWIKVSDPDSIQFKTYKEISEILNKTYGINSSEQDVFLLHEPSIEQMEEDLRILYASMDIIY